MAVSKSNTKAQILEAYNELYAKMKATNASNAALQKQLKEKEEEVKKASGALEEDWVSGIESLKQRFAHSVDELAAEITQEREKLGVLRRSLEIEKEELETLYDVRANAESVDALVVVQREAKEKFDQEMKDAKEEWKREKEAYEYSKGIERRNEEQEYQDERKRLEKELKEKMDEFERRVLDKEAEWVAKDQELEGLRREAAEFEHRISETVEKAEKSLKDQLTRDFKHTKALENKDMEVQIKLYQQEVTSLKSRIGELEAVIQDYKSTAESASNQVRDIAVRAIESSGSQRGAWSEALRISNEKREDKLYSLFISLYFRYHLTNIAMPSGSAVPA